MERQTLTSSGRRSRCADLVPLREPRDIAVVVQRGHPGIARVDSAAEMGSLAPTIIARSRLFVRRVLSSLLQAVISLDLRISCRSCGKAT
jgi:hypothetical protein